MAAPWRKNDLLDWVRSAGLEPPALYGLGFEHNNCGGRRVRGGIGHWRQLLEQLPARYREAEELEQELRSTLGKDVSILREQRGGERRNLTLRELRERCESAVRAR
ncbi:hypothetical protein [Streptacidiphilus sp. EB129]|uniref:hypothetical protein n=1 Tax=Streptacidiphilus sp. EB129 TaxID=3156262 RepID=UPI0035115F84